jgi:hypothetical protein
MRPEFFAKRAFFLVSLFCLSSVACIAVGFIPTGDWNSSWGPVSIRTTGEYFPDGSMHITGSWNEGHGHVGTITRGAVSPNTNKFWFEFYQPWDGVTGTARFTRLDNGNYHGTFTHNNGPKARLSGTWDLTRPSGYHPVAAVQPMPGAYQAAPAYHAPAAVQPMPAAYQVPAAPKQGLIAGTWNSDWGPVVFKVGARRMDGWCPISGHWNQGGGKVGTFTGLYSESGRGMSFSYYMPWTNTRGKANLKLLAGNRTLQGTWTQPGSSGAWTMTR